MLRHVPSAACRAPVRREAPPGGRRDAPRFAGTEIILVYSLGPCGEAAGGGHWWMLGTPGWRRRPVRTSWRGARRWRRSRRAAAPAERSRTEHARVLAQSPGVAEAEWARAPVAETGTPKGTAGRPASPRLDGVIELRELASGRLRRAELGPRGRRRLEHPRELAGFLRFGCRRWPVALCRRVRHRRIEHPREFARACSRRRSPGRFGRRQPGTSA